MLKYAFLPLLWCCMLPRAFAAVVINEVMWMGTDQSSSDEWLELTADAPTDLSGWRLTSVSSKGDEVPITTFQTGTTIDADTYFVIARAQGADTRLALPPAVAVTSLTLLNTKLVLRLYDATGVLADEVNAGAGTPFAGANPSGGIGRASMERIDAAVSGSDVSNWRTALTSLGFKEGTQSFGTPGFANTSGAMDVPPEPPLCNDPLVPRISIQSGTPGGVGKVTINMEVVAASGSLTHAVCRWQFGDGSGSDSCNPSSHTYDRVGTYTAQADVQNQCGNTMVLTQIINVMPSSDAQPAQQSAPWYDGSRIALTSALPNPSSADKDKEWIELKNLEDHTVMLTGWKVRIETSVVHSYDLKGAAFLGPLQTLRLYQLETGLSLPNKSATLHLINPDGLTVSSIAWTDAEEGRICKPTGFRFEELSGTVTKVVDGDTFQLSLDPASARLMNTDTITVRLLGVDAPETVDSLMPAQPSGPEASEFLKALILDKKVELTFDTEVWDSFGRLLAYVYLDDGRLVQDQILINGFGRTFQKYSFVKKELFMTLEESARKRKIGLWALTGSLTPVTPVSAQQEKRNATGTSSLLPQISTGAIFVNLAITEIYASPPSSPDGSGKEVRTVSDEWVEVFNPTDYSVSLVGWSLSVGKKSKIIVGADIIPPYGFILLYPQDLGLKLLNSGTEVALLSPDRLRRAWVKYPALAKATSYVLADLAGTACIVKNPTPGSAGDCAVSGSVAFHDGVKSPVKKAVSAAKSRKNTKIIAYATSYLADLKEAKSDISLVGELAQTDSTQLLSVIIISFLAGLCFSAAGSMFLIRVRHGAPMTKK